MRSHLDVNVLHDRNPQFVQLSDGSIRNGYQIKILNMRTQPRSFRITLDGLDGATLKLEGSDLVQGGNGTLDVKANQLRNVRAFVTLSRDAIAAKTTDFAFRVVDTTSADTVTANVRFEAPSGTGQ
jgi:polyferredoxin